ncbi:hypothetical protein [Dyella silvatica]|uniref:hypothetical protein n=1 Tax=Dyella silvatica TaxID=2992128 RepID=UPI00225243AD|nr:hypothetical protein [Dyella silvatica]
MKRAIIAITASLLAASIQAQTASQPLNLKLPPASQLPPSDLPAASSTSASKPSSAPGVYYGDTSGHVETDDAVAKRAPDCDDATYNKPQTHGSVGMGVVSGSHMGTGTYNSGNVNITQRMGSCDHPTGSIGVSIGVSRFNGRGF